MIKNKNYFQFSKVDHVEMYTFDQSLEQFRQQMVDHGGDSEGTIREIIQNSLDAKNPEIEAPVKIDLSVLEVDRRQIPGLDEVFDHITALNPQNTYTSETVKHMRSKHIEEKVTVLTAEDSNTQGLSGAESEDGGTYSVYAYNKGVHAEHSNLSTEKTRGGSHGVGKIANNAASDIHLMYFANCDEYGNQHLGGSVQLFDHELDEQAYRGTGYYADLNEKNELIPRRNAHHNSLFFRKNTRGLKIIVPYLRAELNNEKDLIKAVFSNFFVAIIEKNLEVTLNINNNFIEINNDTINEVLKEYYPTEVSEMKKEFLPLYVQTYLNTEPRALQVTLPKKYGSPTFNFKLYFYDEDEEIPTGRTAIVRSMGMKIEDRKVPSHVRTPYNAVLIGGPEEDEYLKTLENESHTILSYHSIRDHNENLKAKKFLNTLNKKIKEVIEESQSEKYETEGNIDTSDLIYEMNWEFDQQMGENSEKVELTNNINVTIDNKKEKRKKHKNRKDEGISGEKNKTRARTKRRPRKKQPDPGKKLEVVNYILPPVVVSRAVIHNEEFISFDFNEIEGANHWERVNLGMILVNGQGEEIDEGIYLKDMYTSINEMNANKTDIVFDDEKIYDVPVLNGKVFLHLKTGQNYNPNLKFIYKVEVES